jgi:hypothetical protein
MTSKEGKVHVVICDACGTVDELGEEKDALRVADDHRRRQPDGREHEVCVVTISGGADYDDLLEYLSRLVDKGGSPLDVLDEEDIPTTKVNVVRDGE